MSKPTVHIALPPEIAELRRKQAEQLAKDAGTNAAVANKADASKSPHDSDDLDDVSGDAPRR